MLPSLLYERLHEVGQLDGNWVQQYVLLPDNQSYAPVEASVDAWQQPINLSIPSGTTNGTYLFTGGTGPGGSINTAGYDSVALTISPGALISGGTFTFLVWDGAAWFPIKCARLSSYNTDSTFIIPGVSTGAQGWTVPCSGYPAFQIQVTGNITGSGIVAISAIASSAPDTSIVTAGIDPQSTLPTMAANAITNNLLQYRGFCAANLTPIAVKSSAGKIHGIYCINNVASARYLKLYNLAVGSVTVGTTAPFKTFLLPASGPTFINLDDLGIYFGTAITMAISTTFADTGDVAPAAADVLTQIDYI